MKHYCPFTIDEDEPIIDVSNLSFDEPELLEIDMSEEKVKKARKTAAKPAAEKKPKVAEDRVTLAQVCEEVGIAPATARRKLREAEVQRPEGQGWGWKPGSRDLEKVKKVLSAE